MCRETARGFGGLVFGSHADDGPLSHPGPRERPLVRDGRGDVSLDHFAPVRVLEHQILPWQQVVRERSMRLPDLVQDRQLGAGFGRRRWSIGP